ncbi:MAG: hypothetical protein A2Y04_06360 [Omnitrophica WOR_2 bacterium GWC2_45_7]|nr:MAG: hypothetical protein A2Y04_06360 [Omnitrophica WOR_2 bacterium GWC2_45_7]
MVASLAKGLLTLEKDQGIKYFAIGPGVLEVGLGSNVLLLSDYAYAADSKEAALEKGKTFENKTFRNKPKRMAKSV